MIETQKTGQQRSSTKHTGETRIERALNEKISKLIQVRELLADPGILVLVKEAVQDDTPSVVTPSSGSKSRIQGPMVKAVYETVLRMGDEPFTKRDVADRMRADGHVFNRPKNDLFYAFQRLLAEGAIVIIREGGGNRPHTYGKNQDNRRLEQERLRGNHDHELPNKDGAPAGAVPPPLRRAMLRSMMVRTAYHCVEGFDQPFAVHDLIHKMRAADYTFVGDPTVSIQPAVKKLLNAGILAVVEEGDGQRPTLYEKRRAETRMGDN